MIVGSSSPGWSDTAELEREVAELKAAIAQTRQKSSQAVSGMRQDSLAFAQYRAHFARRAGRLREEADSVKAQLHQYRGVADSLAQAMSQRRTAQRELDLRHAALSSALRNACDSLLATLSGFPPTAVEKQMDALEFLRGELSARAVSGPEALERLWQLYAELEQSGSSIDAYTAPSPVPFIEEQADFLRVGHAYLAVVDQQGQAAALWTPLADSSGGGWMRIEDAESIRALRHAVDVRRGNAVPDIARLPMHHPVESDTVPDGVVP